MPTSGVHITVLELLARDAELKEILEADDEEGEVRLAFAKLGAIGPDLFYALADFGPGLQDLFNYLVKTAGAFECIYKLYNRANAALKRVENDVTFGTSGEFDAVIGEFEETIEQVGSVIHTSLLSLLVDGGINLFPFLEARRQLDFPREKWFWADNLHYVRTGQFTKSLLQNSAGNPQHRAYAVGYMTHYVTDVVGHPYINQVVRSPWRMYWQRHHLVENFVDAYTWARWHDQAPRPDDGDDDPPPDVLRQEPRADFINGAPFTQSRLNDQINIGIVRGDDPVDRLIDQIREKIERGLFDVGIAEANPELTDDHRLRSWAEFMAATIRQVYDAQSRPPENLRGQDRADGYPTPDDILSSYSLFRLFLRVATENKISEPEFPDLAKDVWEALQKTWKDLLDDLGDLPNPLPVPGVDPTHVSFRAVWASIMDWARRAVEFAEKLGKAAIHFIRNNIHVAGVAVRDIVRAGLYLFRKALFDIYMSFRHVLVRAGYAIPFTSELFSDLGGGVSAIRLWTTPSSKDELPFPFEELPGLQREELRSHYVPWVYPNQLGAMGPTNLIERQPTRGDIYPFSADPSAFIEGPLGDRVLLSPEGLQGIHAQFDGRIFGGAVENCRVVLSRFLTAESDGSLDQLVFPDYNLDGDRGYAWPCWEQSLPPYPDGRHFHELSPSPTNPEVTVDAVVI